LWVLRIAGRTVGARRCRSRAAGSPAWHIDPGRLALITAARASVFHDAFLIGAGFAVIGVLLSLLLPTMNAVEHADVKHAEAEPTA
jgi:hypothetical protein